MYDIKSATRDDLATMIYLEERHFGVERAEVQETYDLVLTMDGNVILAYKGGYPEGMLATVPVSEKLKTHALNLPGRSPFRKRIERGYLDPYDGYNFVMSFVPPIPTSLELIHIFLGLKRAVGFVYETSAKSLEFYLNRGCRIVGEVENIHSPGKRDIVLVLEK